jgi:hypothetical protein
MMGKISGGFTRKILFKLVFMIHHEICPFKAYLKKEFLYDLDPSYEGEFVEGTIFAISSYPGEAPTFQILLSDGCLFSYMPIQAMQKTAEPVANPLESDDLVFRNSPSSMIVVTHYGYLQGDVLGFFRRSSRWLKGVYMSTVDWFDDNEQFHLISLENGQYALLPNHKLKFRSQVPSFPHYKKLHKTWRVE